LAKSLFSKLMVKIVAVMELIIITKLQIVV